jgi:hypothetical protein
MKDLAGGALLERISSFLGFKCKTVRELNDAEFLALFDIPEVQRSLGRGYNIKSMTALVDHYRQRVGDNWLQPPSLLADLGINTATASDEEVIACADQVLDCNIEQIGLLPALDQSGDIDWNASLMQSTENVLRINRHSWWPLLGHAYLCTNDEKYARAFARQMSSWMDLNFPMDEQDADNPIWSNQQIAYRLRVSWIPAFGMFYESPHFNSRRKMDMLRCIFDQARVLKEARAKHNLLMDGGLVSAGISFHELGEARNWRQAAVSRFRDGVNGIESETSDNFWSWNVLNSSDRALAESH